MNKIQNAFGSRSPSHKTLPALSPIIPSFEESRLSREQIQLITQNLPSYLQAEKETGVPWRLLAAIHYRENSLLPKTKKAGGPMQFDPPFNQGEDDFQTALILAGRFLQHKMSFRLQATTDDPNLIKEALWRYNGAAYGHFDHSPYVMSNLDAAHTNMRIKGSIRLADGTRKKINAIDKRLGGFVVYEELKKLFNN